MIDDLVKKFHNSDCDSRERRHIIRYFLDHPDELNQYFSEEEWDSFNHDRMLDETKSEQLIQNIKNKIGKSESRLLRPYYYAAAAVLIFAISTACFFLLKSTPTEQIIANHSIVLKEYLVTNGSDTIKTFNMPDGSLVKLMPQSEIRYNGDYNKSTREIFIEGKADFKVFKDHSRPFIVHHKDISATALGTQFTVNAFKGSNIIAVHLYEGKLLVKQSKENKQLYRYFLYPGDEYLYNKTNDIAKLIRNKNGAHLKRQGDLSTSEHLTNWYMFNDQGLDQVLDQLNLIYDVRINYDRSVAKNIRFIGRIDSSDTLANILRDIARINQLEVDKKGNTYYIVKKR